MGGGGAAREVSVGHEREGAAFPQVGATVRVMS